MKLKVDSKGAASAEDENVVESPAASEMGLTYQYDAFISYRHDDRQSAIARQLQHELHQFAKPWYHRQAVRLYRDETNLSVRPDLWGQIQSALDESRFLILMASPEAAASKWVNQEAEHWLQVHGEASILIVLTAGTLAWDSTENVFDPVTTDALPPSLLAGFHEEPLWVDLSWVQNLETDLQIENSKFRDVVASIAATLRNVGKDEISGEEIRQQRRTRRTALSALMLISLLAVASILASIGFLIQREQTALERDDALARLLAAEGHRRSSLNPDDGIAYFLSSLNINTTPSAISGLFQNLQRDPHIAMENLGAGTDETVTAAAIRSERNIAVLGLDNGDVLFWNLYTDSSTEGEATLTGQQRVITLETATGGEILDVAIGEEASHITALDLDGHIYRWVLADGVPGEPKLLATLPMDSAAASENRSREAHLSSNGNSAVVATYSEGIVSWQDGGEVRTIMLPDQAAGGPIALSDDGERFVSVIAKLNPPALLYNLADDSIIELPKPRYWPGALIALGISPDDRYVVGGTMSNVALLWELSPTPRFVRYIEHPENNSLESLMQTSSVTFNETTTYIATYYSGYWHIWDLVTGILIGHPIESAGQASAYAGNGPKLLIPIEQNAAQIIDHSLEHLRYWACRTNSGEIPPDEWRDIVGDSIEPVSGCAD